MGGSSLVGGQDSGHTLLPTLDTPYAEMLAGMLSPILGLRFPEACKVAGILHCINSACFVTIKLWMAQDTHTRRPLLAGGAGWHLQVLKSCIYT